MANKIEMSLDEIIESTKKMKVQRGSATPRRGGGGAGGKPYHRGGRQFQTAGETNRENNNKGGRGGAVLKDRNHGGIQKTKFSRGGVNYTRNQNRFDGPNRGRDSLQGSYPNFGSGPTKILISNLDYGVSDADIKELFGELGPMKSASVHYGKSGRSLGTADIVYERKADALKAIKQYNGVPLDGRPMTIQLATSDVASVSVKTRLSIPPTKPRALVNTSPRASAKNSYTPNNNNRGRGTRGSRGGSAPQTKGQPGGRRTKAPTPTAEELDAELDAYLISQQSVQPKIETADQ